MRKPQLGDRVHWNTGVGDGLSGRIVALQGIPEQYGTMAVEWDPNGAGGGQCARNLSQRLLAAPTPAGPTPTEPPMEQQAITPEAAARFIRASRGRFFGCTFVKRSTGETRQMWCRFAKVGAVKGPHRTRDDLIVVWDHHQRGYRSIPVEGLRQLRIDGAILPVRSGA